MNWCSTFWSCCLWSPQWFPMIMSLSYFFLYNDYWQWFWAYSDIDSIGAATVEKISAEVGQTHVLSKQNAKKWCHKLTHHRHTHTQICIDLSAFLTWSSSMTANIKRLRERSHHLPNEANSNGRAIWKKKFEHSKMGMGTPRWDQFGTCLSIDPLSFPYIQAAKHEDMFQ